MINKTRRELTSTRASSSSAATHRSRRAPKGVGTGASLTADFIVYSTVKGAFAGMSVDGSVLDVRSSLNQAYYGKPVTPIDILVKKDVASADAASLRSTVKAIQK